MIEKPPSFTLGKILTAPTLTTEFEKLGLENATLDFKKGPNSKSSSFIAKERLHALRWTKKSYCKTRDENSKEGKYAETKFHVISENAQFALGLASPKTGRTHQIRVHAKEHAVH